MLSGQTLRRVWASIILIASLAGAAPALAQDDEPVVPADPPADVPAPDPEPAPAPDPEPDPVTPPPDADPGDPADPDPDDPGDGDGEDPDGDDEEPAPPPPPQVSLQGLVNPAPAPTDVLLRDALASVDQLDAWFAATPTTARLSLVIVTGPPETRDRLLANVDALVENREETASLLKASIDTSSQLRDLDDDLEALAQQRTVLVGDVADARDDRDLRLDDLAIIEDAIASAAVGFYVNEQGAAADIGIGSVSDYNDREELAVRVDATLEELASQRTALETRIAELDDRIDALDESIELVDDETDATNEAIASVEAALDVLADDAQDLADERVAIEDSFPELIAALHEERLLGVVPDLGLTLVTLDTYLNAAETIGQVHPNCGIRWEMIAGIAKIESDHGRFADGSVQADGQIEPGILGPLLDGTLEGTAIIVDSDNGTMDGNSSFDRAVGPFQFLPSTWYSFGLDGDGDGFADPHNLYDGARSAAGYLCSNSPMTLDTDIERSVLIYNNSRHYLADVTGVAASVIGRIGLPDAEYDPADYPEEPVEPVEEIATTQAVSLTEIAPLPAVPNALPGFGLNSSPA